MTENETAPRPRRGAKPSGRPTLKTIAQMTGLATTTISRALNNAPELAQETRDRIQKIAAEIGYVPDRTALRLKTGRTNVITLVLAPDEEIFGFGASLVNGLSLAMRDTTYHLVVTPHFRNIAPIEPIRHIVHNRLADGVVFSKTEPFDERVKFLQEYNFPFITHGRTDWPEQHAYVDFDNQAFAQRAVQRLAERGATKVSIVLPDSSLTYSQHLRNGLETAAAEAGLAWEVAADVNLDSSADAIRDYVIRRRRRPDAPDGFVCCSEVSALSVLAGLTESGLVVGQNCFVVTKQSSPLFTQFRPDAETVFEDFTAAGERLGLLLLRLINGEPADTLQHLEHPDFEFSDPP
ncbi:LacI family transcriptional regulator [Devosia rhodophyticola]|uniref:LacI family transcriptional regulator n=1 Tax=Devosia rhodophyticola TaxID=3026423 RepID=A0ABY7Z073_9HYPH|nr:LacI family transcriptional regulator [Devosia rhodophyticola]WDR07011.1 LacI family transcriptional regulator [Devosia rhodophyticola]